ncbi:unnamed protein product [Echinostoma caproni]|uniref:Uncharacterized protein n=1 Tax=Echinostoma caproni TaxID=27848 RepID=A0A183AQD1_9TREM|nr:unnamed protein product [Echinostoma caproni]
MPFLTVFPSRSICFLTACRGSKASRGQNQQGIKVSSVDGAQSANRRLPGNLSNTHSAQNLTEPVRLNTYPDSSVLTDPQMTGPRQAPMTTADAENTMPNSSIKPSNTTPAPNTVAATMYDPAVVQSYLAQVQGYLPGLPCSAPHCSTCYPVLDSTNYINNASPPAVQQPMLLTRSLLGGVGSARASGTSAPPSCYLWLGQDAEAQKQIYQAQLALSQLSLNPITPGIAQNYAVASDCSTGVPLVPTNPTGEPASGGGQLLNSVSNICTCMSILVLVIIFYKKAG